MTRMDADHADATRHLVQFPKNSRGHERLWELQHYPEQFGVIRGIRVIRVIVVHAVMPAPRQHSGPSVVPDEQRSRPRLVPLPASFLGVLGVLGGSMLLTLLLLLPSSFTLP